MGHAEKVIERILFLKGTSDVVKRGPLKIGKSVPEMLRNDLEKEYSVIAFLKASIALCEEEQDHQSRNELAEILDNAEEHIDWLETQASLLKDLGIENYLQAAAGGGG